MLLVFSIAKVKWHENRNKWISFGLTFVLPPFSYGYFFFGLYTFMACGIPCKKEGKINVKAEAAHFFPISIPCNFCIRKITKTNSLD
jgi:hypothetical protein